MYTYIYIYTWDPHHLPHFVDSNILILPVAVSSNTSQRIPASPKALLRKSRSSTPGTNWGLIIDQKMLVITHPVILSTNKTPFIGCLIHYNPNYNQLFGKIIKIH